MLIDEVGAADEVKKPEFPDIAVEKVLAKEDRVEYVRLPDDDSHREKTPRADELLSGAVLVDVTNVEGIDAVWVRLLVR